MSVARNIRRNLTSGSVSIRIQCGIPIPKTKPRGRNGKRKAVYPWLLMEVGDSFLFPQALGRAAHSAVYQASLGDRKFVTRKTDEGYRCWRVE